MQQASKTVEFDRKGSLYYVEFVYLVPWILMDTCPVFQRHIIGCFISFCYFESL